MVTPRLAVILLGYWALQSLWSLATESSLNVRLAGKPCRSTKGCANSAPRLWLFTRFHPWAHVQARERRDARVYISVCFVGEYMHLSAFPPRYPLTLLVSDLNVSLILAPACRQGCPTMIVVIWQGLTYTWFNPSCLRRVCWGTSLFHRSGQGLVTGAVSPLLRCKCEEEKKCSWKKPRMSPCSCISG